MSDNGIVEPGKVVISEDGVLATDFTFNNLTLQSAKEAAMRWALQRLKEAMWEEGMRNL